MPKNPSLSVYVSYAWATERQNPVVEKLEAVCRENAIDLLRDNKEIEYLDSIDQYMRELGASHCIIIVLSDNYLRSQYCMFELLEIHKNKDFHNRVFPIVLEGTKIYSAEEWLDHTQYWEKKSKKLQKKMKKGNLRNINEVNYDLNLYNEIRDSIVKVMSVLGNMNSLTEQVHIETNFTALIDKIKERQNNTINHEVNDELAKNRREKVCREIADKLLQTKEAYTGLDEKFKKEYQLPGNIDNEVARSELANIIMDMYIVNLLKIFDAWMTGLLALEKKESARTVKRFVYFILPIVFDQEVIDTISSKSQYEVCTVPVATTTVAEIVMAGVDGRPAQYILQEDLHAELCGENNLTNHLKHPPNLGMSGVSQHVKVVADHLVNEYCGIKDLAKRKTITSERLIQRAAGELQRLSKYSSRTLYCVYQLPEDTENRQHCILLLEALKKDFPSLIMMELSDDEAVEDDEYETYHLLRKIHTTKIED